MNDITPEFSKKIAEILKQYGQEYLEEHSIKTSKTSALMNQFFSTHMNKIAERLAPEVYQAQSELNFWKDSAKHMRKRVEEICLEIKDAELKKEKLKERFSDPKIREAYDLYCAVIEKEGKDQYSRSRAITAGGIMAAAALGMKNVPWGGFKEEKNGQD